MENKRIAIFLGHPAHFHLFKNVAKNLQNDGFEVDFLIKNKDGLKILVEKSGYKYYLIKRNKRKNNSKISLFFSVLAMQFYIFRYFFKRKPLLCIGTMISYDRFGMTSIICNEDDAEVVPLLAKLSYPSANVILNPIVCDSGKWNEKAIKYHSYHELAYLHPNHFTPDKKVVAKYILMEKPYFVIRFAQLNAHHDLGINGINTVIAKEIIKQLKPYGNIYITSERELEPCFESYRLNIDILDIHHVLAFADLYIGDSQTMAAEAGVLGVPFIRFNDFVGKIGYLRELEDVYKLGYGIKPNQTEKLFQVIEELLIMPNRKEVFQNRQKKMLHDKIDYAKFLTWFIEDFPESKKIMQKNSNFQFQFK